LQPEVVPLNQARDMQNSDFPSQRRKVEQSELTRILSAHEYYAAGRGGVRAQFKCADLDGAILANRNLDEADFTGASLVGANFFGSSLLRASLYCADLRNANLRNVRLTSADMRGASFKGADLSFAVLDNADLRAAKMMMMDRDGVSLVDRSGEKTFGGVDFTNCSLKNTSFSNARLDGANFSGALLLGASFRGARLTDARFKGAVIMGVNLAELKLPPETFAGCVMDVGKRALANAGVLKSQLELHQRWIASDGKEGKAAVLDGEDLRPLHDQFAGRSLIGLSARNTIAIGVDFSGCQLQGAKFDGADLRAANFSGAELSGASFHDAKLVHARFERARLCNLHLYSGETVSPNLLGAEASAEQFRLAILEESLAALGLATGTETAVD
jgi:uncharacterized protein YjbI with pentapeptide repeats